MNEKSIEKDALLSAPKPSTKHMELLLAAAILMLSYGGVTLIHPFHMGIKDTILLICFLLIVFTYTYLQFPLQSRHYKQCAFLLLSCIPNLLFDNYFLKFFNFCFIIILTSWFLMDATHKQIGNDIRQYVFMNLFAALILHPLHGLYSALTSIFRHLFHELHMRHIAGILGGILLSIPILFLVLPLLISADSSFQHLIISLFFHLDDIFIQIGYILFTIPVFCYLYTLIYAHVNCERSSIVKIKAEQMTSIQKKRSIVPASILLTMECILIAIYVLFLIMTCNELMQHIGTSLLSFSYSTFARQGFFELCIIAFINISILGFVQLFTKQKDSRIYQIIQFVLCLVTIFIIVTAMGKMGLYVYMYGLTPLRIYSSWFMLVLLGMFLIRMDDICRKKGFLIYTLAKYFCICFLLLNLLNMNHFIKFYNQNVPLAVQSQQ